jgi:hypothetical protein
MAENVYKNFKFKGDSDYPTPNKKDKSTINSLKSQEDKQELEKYKPHKTSISNDLLKQVRKKKLGKVNGIIVYLVDGAVIRDKKVDIDFTTGGNPGRYKFVPDVPPEIWVEYTMRKIDIVGSILHEYVEMEFMKNKGYEYSKAHRIANIFETKLRDKILAGLKVDKICEFLNDYLKDEIF